MKKMTSFAIDYARYALLGGSKKYYAWLSLLSFFILIMSFTAYKQFTTGLILTGVTDQVTWELYMVNFVFMVGVAAAAVTVVFPAYVYKHKGLKELYVLGEILALVAVPLCIVFILFHMGRPDRLWHLLPVVGIFNLPHSMLNWDVVALNGYLYLNLGMVVYYLYCRYTGTPLNKKIYLPFVYLAILWAPSIHILTAFILNTLPAVHLWASSTMPIRFMVTAFSAGPSMIIIIFLVLKKTTKLVIADEAIDLLAHVVVWCLGLTILLTVSEIVTELYPSTERAASLKNLMLGTNGLNALVPWFWTSATLLVGAFILFLIPKVRKHHSFFLPLACMMTFVGIWIEKGMTLVIPAFTPTPIGEYVVYFPTWIEIFNCIGIWAAGIFAFTVITKGAVGVLVGDIKYSD